MKPAILARVLRLAARAVAASAGGFSPSEIKELAGLLIDLGADLIASLPDRDG
jgi:tellurite resistance protein